MKKAIAAVVRREVDWCSPEVSEKEAVAALGFVWLDDCVAGRR